MGHVFGSDSGLLHWDMGVVQEGCSTWQQEREPWNFIENCNIACNNAFCNVRTDLSILLVLH